MDQRRVRRRKAPLPIVAFARTWLLHPDPIAKLLCGAIAAFSALVLLLPISSTVQRAAAQRFHLAGWSFGGWALLQPVPSMYNFQNRWDVTFVRSRERRPSENDCARSFHGLINHHVFARILLERAALENCGLPARVAFRTEYQTTSVETDFLLTGRTNSHGFDVVRVPND